MSLTRLLVIIVVIVVYSLGTGGESQTTGDSTLTLTGHERTVCGHDASNSVGRETAVSWDKVVNGLVAFVSLVIVGIGGRHLIQMYALRDEVKSLFAKHKQGVCRPHHLIIAYGEGRVTHALALLTTNVSNGKGYRQSVDYKRRQTAALWFCKNAMQDDVAFLQSQRIDTRNDITIVALLDDAIQAATQRERAKVVDGDFLIF